MSIGSDVERHMNNLTHRRNTTYVTICMTITALVVCITPGSSISQTENRYYSRDGHFSFTIPEGWERIPDDVMSLYSDMISDSTGAQLNGDFEAAFQRESDGYFKWPYMGLIVDTGGEVPRKTRLRGAKLLLDKEWIDDKADEGYEKFIKGARIGEVVYHETREMLLLRGEIKGTVGDRLNTSEPSVSRII